MRRMPKVSNAYWTAIMEGILTVSRGSSEADCGRMDAYRTMLQEGRLMLSKTPGGTGCIREGTSRERGWWFAGRRRMHTGWRITEFTRERLIHGILKTPGGRGCIREGVSQERAGRSGCILDDRSQNSRERGWCSGRRRMHTRRRIMEGRANAVENAGREGMHTRGCIMGESRKERMHTGRRIQHIMKDVKNGRREGMHMRGRITGERSKMAGRSGCILDDASKEGPTLLKMPGGDAYGRVHHRREVKDARKEWMHTGWRIRKEGPTLSKTPGERGCIREGASQREVEDARKEQMHTGRHIRKGRANTVKNAGREGMHMRGCITGDPQGKDTWGMDAYRRAHAKVDKVDVGKSSGMHLNKTAN
jgi:hypothetical protein